MTVRIRWKLLLLLLTISLLPALAIGLSGLSTMRHMGADVSRRTRETLSLQARANLRRLIEDHALVLHREFDLLQAVLGAQARDVEDLLSHPPQSAALYVRTVSEGGMGQGMGGRGMGGRGMGGMMRGMMNGMDQDMRHMMGGTTQDGTEQPGPGETGKAAVPQDEGRDSDSDSGRMGIFSPGAVAAGEGQRSADIRALSHMAPLHARARDLLGDLALRQFTALDDGVFAFYPARESLPAGSVPMMYDPRRMPWYSKPLETGGMTWSLPYEDPFTGEPVITVSTPVRLDGRPVGVTAICVPLAFLLHQNPQHLLFSGLHTWIVRPADDADGNRGLRLVAADVSGADAQAGARTELEAAPPSPGNMRPRGQGLGAGAAGRRGGPFLHRWRLPRAPEWFRLKDPAVLEAMIADIDAGNSGDRLVDLAGNPSAPGASQSSGTSLLAYAPIFHGGTALVIAVPEQEVVAQATATGEYITAQARKHEHTVIFDLAAVLAVCLGVALLVSRRITRVVASLAGAVSRVAKGDFAARAPVIAHDELGDLAQTFNSLVPALEDQVRMKETLRLAQGIQSRLQPHSLPAVPGFDVAGGSDSCDETGGDYYDFIGLADGRLVAAVGDVSGHGLPAALLMASIRGFLRGRSVEQGSLSAVAGDVNRLVLADTYETGDFMTLFLLSLDPATGGLAWLRAGHDPAFLYAPGHPRAEAGGVLELAGSGGTALGVDPEAVYPENAGVALAPGQVVLLATDGVWEATDGEGRQYGKDRLKRLLAGAATASAEEIRRLVVEDVRRFSGCGKQQDDVTVVVIKALQDTAAMEDTAMEETK
ncbi:serine phosphatase [Desulfovibrio sp. X2]|uniref:SpoIIE family protein phosphatase n=1 Tax=Desulfovibrio sp. X2 TaxID=941449 RepID=UPI000358709E|nr:SpoIIE family protein phosphatase [Desulfovibrio sp. X2]EPR39792.1 serine phosphatase [Desulfovibrio sp. X2]